MTKDRQENDMTDHISLVYAEIETKFLGPIWPDLVCDEN